MRNALQEMNALVEAELAAFAPGGHGDLAQGIFRSAYQQVRANGLGAHPETAGTIEASCEAAVATTRQQCGDPSWTPRRT